MTPTHELAFFAVPALAGPAYAIRAWVARRRARRLGAIRIGDRLPAWGPLPDTEGRYWGPKDLRGRATVFVFMSNRCPGVKAYDARLAKMVVDYAAAGVRFISVNSIPEGLYPSESMAEMMQAARERRLTMPYLKDPDQTLKRMLGAVCTPQVFALDSSGRLRYQGRIDDAFLEARASTHDLREALDAVLARRPVPRPETTPLGCSIDPAPLHRSARQARPSTLAATAA